MTGVEDPNISPEADAAMSALYRRFDDQVPEGEPDYDVTAGLGKLLNRLQPARNDTSTPRRQAHAEPTGSPASHSRRGSALEPAPQRHLSVVTCGNCESQISEYDAFCGNCGSPRPMEGALRAAYPPQGRQPGPAEAAHPTMSAQASDDSESSQVNYDSLGMEPTLDPLRNRKYRHQVARKFAACLGTAILAGVIAALMGLPAGGFWAAVGAVGAVGAVLVLALATAVFWLMPVTALLGHWGTLITYRGPLPSSMLEGIGNAVRRHQIPLDSLLRAEQPHDHLKLRHGPFTGYISCFQSGTDLYVGWTYWIRLSPVRLLAMRLHPKSWGETGVYSTLRFESAKATVVSMHACVLQALELVEATTSGSGSSSRLRGHRVQ
jgi:hypothetical protein